MKEIGSVYGIKIIVDSAVPTNEAWLLKEDQVAIFKKISELKNVLESSGIRVTGISLVAG